MGDMSDSIITQKAILFIKAEYEAMGMDLNDVQMNYLLSTGAKMLGLTLLMMAAAILAGLLSSRTAAKIGMDLRGKVFTLSLIHIFICFCMRKIPDSLFLLRNRKMDYTIIIWLPLLKK